MRRKVFRRGWRRQRRSAECTSLRLCRVHEGVHYCVQQQQNRKPSVCPLHTQHLYGVWARPDSMFCDCAHMGSCWLRQPDRRRDVAQCSTIRGNAGFDCRQQAESLFQMVRGLNLGFRLDCRRSFQNSVTGGQNGVLYGSVTRPESPGKWQNTRGAIGYC